MPGMVRLLWSTRGPPDRPEEDGPKAIDSKITCVPGYWNPFWCRGLPAPACFANVDNGSMLLELNIFIRVEVRALTFIQLSA